MKQGCLSAADHIVYVRIVDILNAVFGCSYKGYQRGYWKKPGSAVGVWFPQSSHDPKDAVNEKGRKPRKWRNIFRKNDTEVVEYWPNDMLQECAQIDTADRRIVFAKFIGKSDYVFMGVYRFSRFDGKNARVYERLSCTFNLDSFR